METKVIGSFEVSGNYEIGAKELVLYYKKYLKQFFPVVLVSIIGFFIPSLVYASLFIWFCVAIILCTIVMAKIREEKFKYPVTFILSQKEYVVISKYKELHWELSKLYRVEETKESIFIYRGQTNFVYLPKYQLKAEDIDRIKQIFKMNIDERRLRFLY